MKENLMIENTLPHGYSIVKNIGKGSFGKTYLCKDKNTEKCIVKYISLPKEDKKFIELAILEAKVLKNLTHKQIPKFLDFHIVETGKNIDIFIIQEYIEAKNLKQLIDSDMHFSEEEVKNITLQLLKILEYIHGFLPQIIHRDIKPANILLTEKNQVFLIDFGAVKEKLTYLKISESGISTIIGTQGYMPIEQFEGKAIPASDIYSLGLTVLYMLSHLEPLQITKDGLNFNFRDKVNISEDFSKIIEKMINPDWKERYRSVLQIKSDLLALKKVKTKMIKTKNSEIILKDLIKDKLYKDETVYSNYRFRFSTVFKQNIAYFIFLPLPLLLLPFIKYITAFLINQNLSLDVILPFEILSAVILFGLFFSFYKYLYFQLKTQTQQVFFITNKRIIIANLLDSNDFSYYSYSGLKDLIFKKIVYKDGSGDFIFYGTKVTKGEKNTIKYLKDIKFQINGIKDLDKNEKLIMKHIYKKEE